MICTLPEQDLRPNPSSADSPLALRIDRPLLAIYCSATLIDARSSWRGQSWPKLEMLQTAQSNSFPSWQRGPTVVVRGCTSYQCRPARFGSRSGPNPSLEPQPSDSLPLAPRSMFCLPRMHRYPCGRLDSCGGPPVCLNASASFFCVK